VAVTIVDLLQAVQVEQHECERPFVCWER
jgi:hypothetical protein